MSQLHLPPTTPPQPPWTYQRKQASAPTTVPFWGQAGLGCLSFFVAGVVGMALMSAAASVTNNGTAMFGAFLLPIGGLVAATLFFRLSLGWRGFLPGVLIAFGIVALLLGLCFAILMVSLRGADMR